MAKSVCNETKTLIDTKESPINYMVKNSVIANVNDYNKIIAWWDNQSDFMNEIKLRKDTLCRLEKELLKLLEVAKSFPKEEININTVTDLQRGFSDAKPFSDVPANNNTFNEISTSIQSIILDVESLEALVNDRLNLCSQLIIKIDELFSTISGSKLNVRNALEPAETAYEEYIAFLQEYEKNNKKTVVPLDFWPWFASKYVQDNGPVHVNYYNQFNSL